MVVCASLFMHLGLSAQNLVKFGHCYSPASFLAGLFLTSNLAQDLKSVRLLGELCRALGMLISHYLFQKQISLRKGYTWDQKPL